MNKIEVIAPIVHAARVAYRQVHAPGKLLPDWLKTTEEQKREVFAVVRDVESGDSRYVSGTEGAYLAAVTAQCFKALFPALVKAVAPVEAPAPEAEHEPAPRRGRR
jgi:hypothetical protein